MATCGSCAMMRNKATAGPVGRRRACSQFCRVLTLTPSKLANSDCDKLLRSRISCTNCSNSCFFTTKLLSDNLDELRNLGLGVKSGLSLFGNAKSSRIKSLRRQAPTTLQHPDSPISAGPQVLGPTASVCGAILAIPSRIPPNRETLLPTSSKSAESGPPNSRNSFPVRSPTPQRPQAMPHENQRASLYDLAARQEDKRDRSRIPVPRPFRFFLHPLSPSI